MRHHNVIKRNKTVYCRDSELWDTFIQFAEYHRISTSEMLEIAMRQFLESRKTSQVPLQLTPGTTFKYLTSGKDTD